MMGENVNSKSGISKQTHSHCGMFHKHQSIDMSHSVKLSSLGNMVKWLSANNDYLFKKEFEVSLANENLVRNLRNRSC